MVALMEILLVAIGTYFFRLIPFYFEGKLNIFRLERFLPKSTTAILSALFIYSFFNNTSDLSLALPNTMALMISVYSYLRTRNFGVSILAGIFIHYFLHSQIFQMLG